MSRERAFSPIPHHSAQYGDDNVKEIDLYGPPVAHSQQTPENIYEALLMTEPHREIRDTQEALAPLREVLNDAIDALDERSRWVFDALFVRRVSLRSLARELGVGKSTIARWRDVAIVKLQEKLVNEPLIIERLSK